MHKTRTTQKFEQMTVLRSQTRSGGNHINHSKPLYFHVKVLPFAFHRSVKTLGPARPSGTSYIGPA